MHCNRPTALPCPLTTQHLDGARASCQLWWRRRKVPDDHDVSGRVSSCRISTLQARMILDHCLDAAFVRSRTVELSQQYRSCCDSASAAWCQLVVSRKNGKGLYGEACCTVVRKTRDCISRSSVLFIDRKHIGINELYLASMTV